MRVGAALVLGVWLVAVGIASAQGRAACDRACLEGIAEQYLEALVAKGKALKVGDPLDEATDVGPMVSEPEAARAASWIEEAVAGGARLVLGGGRNVCSATVHRGGKHPSSTFDVPGTAVGAASTQ